MSAATHHATQPRRLRRGCLVLVALLLVPYLINFEVVLAGSYVHQAWWSIRGSDNYSITISESSFGFTAGTSVATVRNGEITAIDHLRGPVDPADFSQWQFVTVETQFSNLLSCGLFFPLLLCTINYSTQYGYPQQVEINCPIRDLCYSNHAIESIQLER